MLNKQTDVAVDILTKRFTLSEDVRLSRIGDETILMQLATGTYLGLDNLGAEIVEKLTAGATLKEICHGTAKRHGVEIAKVEEDCRIFMDDLVKNQIVVER